MKKFLSFLLIFAMFFSAVGSTELSVKAESLNGNSSNGIDWTCKDGVLTISGSGYMDDFANRYGEQEIPWNGLDIKKVVVKDGVKSIGNFAFCNEFNNIESVELPDSIERIGMYAFSECTSLENIEIPDNVNFIGESAFEKCPIDSVNLPEGLEFIAGNSFYGCSNLTEVIIPDSVTEIRAKAFFGCEKLKSVVFGKNLRRIGEEAFAGCTLLENVSVNENLVAVIENAFQDCSSIKNVTYASDSGKAKDVFELHILGKKTITYETEGQCGENAYWRLDGDVLTVSGSGKISVDDGEDVAYTRLDRAIIKNSNIKTLIIENGITELEEVFISGNKTLETVILPSTLELIDIYAFRTCSNLRYIFLPDGEYKISACVFEGCNNLKSIYIPSGVMMDGLVFGTDSTGNKPVKSDITVYTPENSNAFNWAKTFGYNLVPSTREEYENAVDVPDIEVAQPAFVQEKADKSAYGTPSFKDITKETDYTDYIIGLGYINLFKGDDQGNFNPESTITRAEFAAIVCRMLGYEKESANHLGKSVFSDVPASHWASGYIYVASKLGIINGYGNGLFGPEDPVTYEQAVKMLICALEYDIVSLCTAAGVPCLNNSIPYPEGYMAIAKEYNLTDSSYKIGDNALRKLIAKLVYMSLNRFTVFGYGDTISISGDPLLKEVFGIGSEEELKKFIEDTKAKMFFGDNTKDSNDISKNDIKDIPNDNVKDTVNDDGKDNNAFENDSNNGLADWINVDYASFKLQYGKAKYAMNYEGPLYQFEENGAWFAFSDSEYFLSSADGTISSNDPKFVEPSPFSVCKSIYTTVNGWLGFEQKGIYINSIADLISFGPIRSYEKSVNFMFDTEYYSGEKDWYGVSVDYNSNGNISGDSPVYIHGLWEKDYNLVSTSYPGKDIPSSENANKLSGTIVVSAGTKVIPRGAYKDCVNITKVILPKSLEKISENAFENCISLKEINIPTGVTYIGADAFKNCDSLEFVKVPHSIKTMIRAFSDCDNLKTVVLLSLGNNPTYAVPFDNSPVENVVIGGNVNRLPLDYFLSGAYNQYKKDDVITNLYIHSHIVDVLGSNFGSALRNPKNIYSIYSKDELKKFMTSCKLSLWKLDQIHDNIDPFDCQYIESSLEKEYDGVKIVVNGKLLIPDVPSPSYMENGIVYASAFDVLEALGMSVEWSPDKKTMVAKGNANTVIVSLEDKQITVNGEVIKNKISLLEGKIIAPISEVISKLDVSSQYIPEKNMLNVTCPVFKLDNAKLIEICSKNDYSFDELYEVYMAQKDIVLPNEKMKEDEYSMYLAAILIELLVSPEYDVFEATYEESKAAAKLLNIKLGGIENDMEKIEKEARKKAITSIDFNLELLYDVVEDKAWKNAIDIVRKAIDNGGEIIDEQNSTWKEFKNKIIDYFFKVEVKYDDITVDKTPDLNTIKAGGKVVKGYIDALNGSFTEQDTQDTIVVTMPVRKALSNLCADLLKKIDGGENKLSNGNLTTDTYIDSGRILVQMMKYLSAQTNVSYNSKENSGLDMLWRIVSGELGNFYKAEYDAIYKKEMNLFNSVFN